MSQADALPPGSRIICEARDDALTIHLRGRGRQWAVAATGGFLGITFFVQAILRGGYAFLFVGIGLTLFALGRLNGNLRKICRTATICVTAEDLTINSFGSNTWKKSNVVNIQAIQISRRRDGAILIESRNGTKTTVLDGFDPREIEWAVNQIKLRWATENIPI